MDNLPDVPFPWVEATPFCGSARHTWGGFSPSFWFDRKFGDRVETGPESAAVKAEGVAGLVTLAASAPACLPPSAAANAAGSCDHVARWGLCCPHGGGCCVNRPRAWPPAFGLGGSCLCPAWSSRGHVRQVDRLGRSLVRALGCRLWHVEENAWGLLADSRWNSWPPLNFALSGRVGVGGVVIN